jgi:hypothetical protein
MAVLLCLRAELPVLFLDNESECTGQSRRKVNARIKQAVTPAEAGVQRNQQDLDSRLRGNDISKGVPLA